MHHPATRATTPPNPRPHRPTRRDRQQRPVARLLLRRHHPLEPRVPAGCPTAVTLSTSGNVPSTVSLGTTCAWRHPHRRAVHGHLRAQRDRLGRPISATTSPAPRPSRRRWTPSPTPPGRAPSCPAPSPAPARSPPRRTVDCVVHHADPGVGAHLQRFPHRIRGLLRPDREHGHLHVRAITDPASLMASAASTALSSSSANNPSTPARSTVLSSGRKRRSAVASVRTSRSDDLHESPASRASAFSRRVGASRETPPRPRRCPRS